MLKTAMSVILALAVAWSFTLAAVDGFHDSFDSMRPEWSLANSVSIDLFSNTDFQTEAGAIQNSKSGTKPSHTRPSESAAPFPRICRSLGLSFEAPFAYQPGERLESPALPTPVKRLT